MVGPSVTYSPSFWLQESARLGSISGSFLLSNQSQLVFDH